MVGWPAIVAREHLLVPGFPAGSRAPRWTRSLSSSSSPSTSCIGAVILSIRRSNPTLPRSASMVSAMPGYCTLTANGPAVLGDRAVATCPIDARPRWVRGPRVAKARFRRLAQLFGDDPGGQVSGAHRGHALSCSRPERPPGGRGSGRRRCSWPSGPASSARPFIVPRVAANVPRRSAGPGRCAGVSTVLARAGEQPGRAGRVGARRPPRGGQPHRRHAPLEAEPGGPRPARLRPRAACPAAGVSTATDTAPIPAADRQGASPSRGARAPSCRLSAIRANDPLPLPRARRVRPGRPRVQHTEGLTDLGSPLRRQRPAARRSPYIWMAQPGSASTGGRP